MSRNNKEAAIRFAQIIINVPFLSCLSEKEIKEIRKIFVEKQFLKRRIIFGEEDTQNYMYVILSGKVKVTHLDSGGKEHILAVHKTGDFFGEMALLDGKTAPATVTAMEDTRILIVSKRDFEEYLLKRDKVLREVILTLCGRLRDAWNINKILSLQSAEDKIRRILTITAMQGGANAEQGTVISAKLKHQEIAAHVSLSRETVTRIMNKLIKEGEIEFLDNRRILLKPSFYKKL